MTILTALLVAVFVLAINLASLAVYRWWISMPVISAQSPDDDVIDAAILHGMRQSGVNIDGACLKNDRDLGHKWHEVLYHAMQSMGQAEQHEPRTVEDLRKRLR